MSPFERQIIQAGAQDSTDDNDRNRIEQELFVLAANMRNMARHQHPDQNPGQYEQRVPADLEWSDLERDR